MQERRGYYAVYGMETLTRQTDYEEVNCDLFGDGCGVIILGPREDNTRGVLGTEFVSDSSGLHCIFQDRFGKLRMPGGKKVFSSATRGMENLIHKLNERLGIPCASVTKYFPHQANGRILDKLADKFDPDKKGKVYRTIEKYGNMSAATIPVAMARAMHRGDVKSGDLLEAVDFGSGFTMGAAAIRF